jgi:uncharacterized membrane protein YgcG
LEGALNDATSRRIIADVITPHLQRGEFFAGIRDGTDAMIGILERSPGQSGELPKPLAQPQSRSPLGEIQAFFPLIIMISLLLGGFFRLLLGRMPGALLTAVLAGVIAWFFAGLWMVCLIAGLVAFVFTLTGGGALGLLSRHRSGRWGNPGDQSGFGIGGNAGGGSCDSETSSVGNACGGHSEAPPSSHCQMAAAVGSISQTSPNALGQMASSHAGSLNNRPEAFAGTCGEGAESSSHA